MSYLTAALLGLIQGLTEFLPVSGSGHFALLKNIFNIEGADLMMDAMLHIGTLISICVVFGPDVRGLLQGGLGLLGAGAAARSSRAPARLRKRLALLVLLGTLPLVLTLPFRKNLQDLGNSTIFVGLMLLLTGFILYSAQRRAGNGKSFRNVSLWDMILVGLGQALAAVPGISRMGTAMSVGLLRGFERTFAFKISVLLSVPAMVGSVIFKFVDAVTLGVDGGMLPVYLLGMVASAVAGVFAIRIMRWCTARGRMGGFAYYCWGAGIVALLLSLVA